ncbi:TetR/AcrR family transcriptional regulator [Lactobacillus agrestimuris]|uniref:TetR/AcrR family transcriptional regulator n=1 Tax=Lactobacillus agrestimuris TaxID=2941328 RepID=UPI00204385C9|nr:TetR/AcrR family transcriptional regulator [Lactobacillus agrestimuris]
MNQKSLRTQKQIEKAMFELLKSTPYDDIAISQITKLAKVSRTSFYRNYEQKDSVIRGYIERQYQNLTEDITENHIDSFTDQLRTYLSFFKRNPEIMMSLLNAGFEGILLNEQTTYLDKMLKIYHPDLALKDYAISYQSGGIFMILVWWVKQDYQTEVNELVKYIQKHILI